MSIKSFINLNHIKSNHRNNFIKLANLSNDVDNSNVKVDVEFDNRQSKQRRWWYFYEQYDIPVMHYSLTRVTCKEVDISEWLNQDGIDFILNNQDFFTDDYSYDLFNG